MAVTLALTCGLLKRLSELSTWKEQLTMEGRSNTWPLGELEERPETQVFQRASRVRRG